MRPWFVRDVIAAGLPAAILSGLPSTLHAWVTGRDLLEPTRAAGAMLLRPGASDAALIAAAVPVHLFISFFWTAVLVAAMPQRHVLPHSVVALAVVALLDLRIIAPIAFPEVAALPFWPQFADHLAFGAVMGLVLRARYRRRAAQAAFS